MTNLVNLKEFMVWWFKNFVETTF